MKNYIWLIAAAVVLVSMVGWAIAGKSSLGEGDGQSGEHPRSTPSTAATPLLPAITIDVFSSNTKENWINAVVEQFNQEQHTIASREPIVVQATHVTSGGSQRDILAGKIHPTVLESWRY